MSVPRRAVREPYEHEQGDERNAAEDGPAEGGTAEDRATDDGTAKDDAAKDDAAANAAAESGTAGESAQVSPRRRLLRLLGPYGKGLAVVVALQAVGALAGLAPLLAVVEIGRTLLAPGPADADRVWTAVAAGAAGLFVQALLITASGGIAHLVDGRLRLSLRRALAARLGSVPLGWYGTRSSGQVTKVVQDDVDQLHHLFAHTPGEATSALVVPAASLTYLAWVDWRLTLVALVPPVLGLLLHRRLMTAQRKRDGRVMAEAMGRIGSAAVEFVQGIRVVKTFGETGRAHRRYREAADDFADFFRGYVSSGAGQASVAALVLSPPVVLLVVLTGGTALIASGTLAPADLLPFPLLSMALTAPVAALGHGLDEIHAAQRSAEQIQACLDAPVIREPAHPVPPQGTRVEFRGVRFAYEPGHEVLRGVDLTLEPGTTTALVGASGAGKSTLAGLLPRFADPDEGAVLLGGADVRDIGSSVLYGQVSFVFQDVRLLRASVADNIALAAPEADREAVEAAARAASVHERILALPRGYDSVIGEDARLSGGEVQRLSIARALLIDAPVLVLDEALSFADARTEAEIGRALATLREGRTQLVVAHRPQTVENADQIAVLDEGRVVECGRYEELLAREGAFADLWRSGPYGTHGNGTNDGTHGTDGTDGKGPAT
ncbi:ATP-binding cassette subfamily B protein [Streptomyces sp. Amel2xB2]|uniref:ABC transporter ATP-binding protein n=1 Tax=Streptomyces sp. Amel2xB2 TaxID=1305829 RepID=UPI000DBFE3B6|nr:ABC transporter ATP-binding protein [Streptomyces sp. Amel2xB2]RAJ67162.1 ATP-binding cassette subfamily B protein [Streptomyces sp. Amel2xB2]